MRTSHTATQFRALSFVSQRFNIAAERIFGFIAMQINQQIAFGADLA